MKLFTKMYEVTVRWAEHKKATWLLGGMSFAESSFFPIPVDAMLAPMALAQPKKWWWFAVVATVMSVIGGLAGYLLGYVFIDQVHSVIEYFNWQEGFANARERIDKEGVWVLFMASFTPIPYKVATISAGTLKMELISFIWVSLVGRGIRFFLVAGSMAILGPVFKDKLDKHLEWIGWVCCALMGLWFVWHVWGDSIKGAFV